MKSFKIQDLISVGIYAAIYYLLMAIAVFALHMGFGIFSYMFIPSGTALVAGIVYLLMTHRIPKFGAITILGLVNAAFFMFSGYFALSFIPSIVCGILADVIQHKTNLPEKIRTLLGYTIFNFSLTGPILPMWFMQDAYKEALASKGKDASYITEILKPVNNMTFALIILSIIVCSIIGLWIANNIYQKHFAKTKGQTNENIIR
ncbi:MptD family putative ECF transporter S component [Vagococcus xieshaowenii]|uniref:Trep_Strep domain-containing protein n=1 Tax=Vagococcus xieshaowenii TaxID=2562451 RepID=A0AAJ5JM94_9ENTE|nr:MptD family putative ECF transporter S component [Vagococcus xieshaowenii]QCA29133.1 Trep_Strep domain-containing protein [Vagococcus xieshaowenii]TFZ40890.1 Trep_Strep domain-containing protein [Vagococcus xieshaowenii]